MVCTTQQSTLDATRLGFRGSLDNDYVVVYYLFDPSAEGKTHKQKIYLSFYLAVFNKRSLEPNFLLFPLDFSRNGCYFITIYFPCFDALLFQFKELEINSFTSLFTLVDDCFFS